MAAEETIQVTFKGVPFLVETETQEGGRKVTVHEYPGSDTRFVEDLGKKPGIFRLKGFVSGDTWVQDARRLTTVLEEEDEGSLELSIFGIVKVKSQAFTKTLNQITLGRVDFQITFLVSTPNPSPIETTSSVETVASAVVEVLEATQENFAENFESPTEAATALVATYDGDQIAKTVAEEISDIGQKLDEVTSKANFVRDNINDLVRDPLAYAASVFNDGLLGTVFDTISVSRDGLTALSKLCRVGFGLARDFESIRENLLSNAIQSFDIPLFSEDTSYRVSNNANRVTIVTGTRIALFATYLNQAARNDYSTDSEINEVASDINDIYENVIMSSNTDPLVALTIDQCRIQALEVLESKLQVTPNVETLTLNVPTVDVELTYRLYAEEFEDADALTTRTLELTDLNGLLPTRYEDDVKVFQL